MTVIDTPSLEHRQETPPEFVLRSARAADAEAITEIINLPGFRIANTRGPFLQVSDMQRMIDGLTSSDRLIVAIIKEE